MLHVDREEDVEAIDVAVLLIDRAVDDSVAAAAFLTEHEGGRGSVAVVTVVLVDLDDGIVVIGVTDVVSRSVLVAVLIVRCERTGGVEGDGGSIPVSIVMIGYVDKVAIPTARVKYQDVPQSSNCSFGLSTTLGLRALGHFTGSLRSMKR